MNTVFLLTGSNIGDSLGYLNQAIAFVQKEIGVVSKKSSVYKTEPWGNKNQQDFLNQVLEVKTVLKPEEVLKKVLAIEREMGRIRIEKWGPRVIDLDILFYASLILDTPDLKVPHPFLHERRFTLLPLNEIAHDLYHPVLHQTVAQLLAECKDTGVVEKM